MSKEIEITWQKSGLHVVGWGEATKGKKITVPFEVADTLIDEGLAKLSKQSKIKKTDKASEGE